MWLNVVKILDSIKKILSRLHENNFTSNTKSLALEAHILDHTVVITRIQITDFHQDNLL